MLLMKILFFTAFCVIDTNAVYDTVSNDACLEIKEDPHFAFSDLDILECTSVEIPFITSTNYGIIFAMKNPTFRILDYVGLNRTEEILFNGNTKVYLVERGHGDEADEWHTVEIKTLKEYMPGFDNVALYHNYYLRASIMLYRQGSSWVVEGVINGKVLRYIPYSDLDDKPKYILVKIGPLKTDEQRREFYLDPYTPEFFDLGAKTLERVHVHLFPIIDGRILNYGIIEPRILLKPILSYYNYIDMLFGVFTSPIISFTLKGIIIPKKETFLPFIDKSDAVPSTIYMSNVHSGVQKFVENEASNFGITPHDIIIFMMGRRIFDDVSVSDGSIASTTLYKRSICETSVHPLIILSVHSDTINDYLLWHLISKFVTMKRIKHELGHCSGFQETYVRMNGRKRTYVPWMDQCIANMMTDYFAHHDCNHFNRNKPIIP